MRFFDGRFIWPDENRAKHTVDDDTKVISLPREKDFTKHGSTHTAVIERRHVVRQASFANELDAASGRPRRSRGSDEEQYGGRVATNQGGARNAQCLMPTWPFPVGKKVAGQKLQIRMHTLGGRDGKDEEEKVGQEPRELKEEGQTRRRPKRWNDDDGHSCGTPLPPAKGNIFLAAH